MTLSQVPVSKRSKTVSATSSNIRNPNSSTSVAKNPEESAPLPPLREDIELTRGMNHIDGSASWIIHDPAGFRHFNIGWYEFEILSRWASTSSAEIVKSVNRETTLTIGQNDVDALENFLKMNGLLRLSSTEMLALREMSKQKGSGRLAGLLSSEIVFKKLPLFRPQKFLEKLVPLTGFVFSRTFWLVLCLLLATSLYLVGRQWDAFTQGVATMASVEGAASFALVMIIAKSLHEMAHGITTVRYGGLVPTMGVAFIVFWPLLYTETSAAWSINDRRKRIIISSAGILAELILASLALALWPYLSDGPLRDTFAFTSTTLLILTIAFNANPLMKFDGYFILSELTRFDNLQPRALALLSSRIKTIMIGKSRPEPEPGLKSGTRRWLLAYGISSAVYRLFLFAGIAYALYQFLPPVLSLPLALAVIISGIVIPLRKFLLSLVKTAWVERRGRGFSRMGLALVTLAAIIFVPVQTTIMVPVIYASGRVQQVFSPEPGKVVSIKTKRGDRVSASYELLELRAPGEDIELAWSLERRVILTRLMERSLTSNTLRDEFHIRKNELSELHAEISGLRDLNNELHLRAAHEGRVTYIIDGLAEGIWVEPKTPLIEIVTRDKIHLTAYVSEHQLDLMVPGAGGSFWLAGNPTQNWQVLVKHIEGEPIQHLDEPYLAENLGGTIRVRIEDSGELTAEQGIYKIELTMLAGQNGPKLPDLKTMGFAKLNTLPRSIFERLSRRFFIVWHREFG